MDKNEKPLRITEEAARDMWAAACGIAKQEVDFDVAPQVNGYLLNRLKELHELAGGGVDDPLGFFIRKPGEESLFEAKQVDGAHTGKTAKLVGESFGSELLVFLLQRAPITDPRILQVVAKFLIELFNVEFSAEGKNDRPRLQAGNDDLGHLGGGE
ncbi:hypothetical protein [Dakarella massiliensis]|uniref:hypothetical protein n=1 Tax=Dakarella massiliensis TaxID=1506471 RepID=UPI0006707661|nr:hypothetical protein [Dakarella massiliensis]DAG75450.1 MAG TPA: hypothetical protein [Caudoviricetes sp.]